MIDQIEAVYGSKICDRENNICKIDKICSAIPRDENDFHISFELVDDISTYKFELNYNSFFNAGIFFGDSVNTCYVVVFKHGAEDMNTVDYDLVLIGNIFMKDYYVVYDMSPLEKGKDYIQVGIGLQNTKQLAGD